MKFSKLAEYFEQLENTSSRTEMTETLTKLFQDADEKEIQEILYLMTARVAPKYVALEFNIAEKMAIKAISKAVNKENQEVREAFKEEGDLGSTVEKLYKEKIKNKDLLDVLGVFDNLKNIAEYEGEGSQKRKVDELSGLIKQTNPKGAKYLLRIVLGTLRLGVGDKTLIDALSWSQTKDKSLSKKIERAYALSSDLGYVGELLFEKGIDAVENIELTPGRPVSAKLTQRENTAEAILDRGKTWYIQPKLDGLRCQIHKWKEKGEAKVELYSRNLETLTHMFPEIVNAAKEIPADSFILDSEVIGYNPETDEFVRFQETIQRRRKYDVGEKSEEFPVYAYCFDAIFYNGKDLTRDAYGNRLDTLQKLLNTKSQQTLKVIETTKVESVEKLNELFDRYVDENLEGLMAKTPNHTYQAGTRNYDWIKLKKSYKNKLADTIDAVVLGYFKGKGAQAKFGIGAFLVGVYNREKDIVQTIAKVGSGVTDEEWPKIKGKIDESKVAKSPTIIDLPDKLKPDVVCEPKIIAVIKADEVTKSPLHSAGYALRFPRLENFDRFDKSGYKQATTKKEVVKMYKNLKQR